VPLKSLLAERIEGADMEAVALAKKMGAPLLTNDRVLIMIARTR
jgi:predicted nucleic acid-binding protein